MADEQPTNQPESPGHATVKRRWAILRGASGGAVVLAVAGAIALSDANTGDQTDHGQDPAERGARVSAES